MGSKKAWTWPKNGLSGIFEYIDQMTPKAKALLVVKACRLMCDSIGVRFLSDMRVFWLSFGAGTMVLIYLILATYTVIYYTYHNDFSRGIKATCVVGVAVPVSFCQHNYHNIKFLLTINLSLLFICDLKLMLKFLIRSIRFDFSSRAFCFISKQ